MKEILIIAVTAIVVYKITINKFFYYKTIVRGLWENILKKDSLYFRDLYNKKNKTSFEKLYNQGKKDEARKLVELKGNIINAVLDYVNYVKNNENDGEDEEAGNETYGYGYFDYDEFMRLYIEEDKDIA